MPIRGIEMRAITGVGGATAAATAAALRWAASAGGVVGAAVGEGDGVAVGMAIARTVRDVATWWTGEWAAAPGMLASSTSTPAASRTTGPRLMELCSHPSGERPIERWGGATSRGSLALVSAAPPQNEARSGNRDQPEQCERRPGDARCARRLARRRKNDRGRRRG